MNERMTSDELALPKLEKVKAINPHIVARYLEDKPYYEISYYDVNTQTWKREYGSYWLRNVMMWLNTCFEIIEADIVPVIKCKNCIFYSDNKPKSQNYRSGFCLIDEEDDNRKREKEDYCSCAEIYK